MAAGERLELSAEEATAVVKRLALYYGAVDVGVTQLRPYHVYSHVGRGSGTWGEPIALDHRWAIAFTVEMDHGVMRAAPDAPVVAESARQYVAAGADRGPAGTAPCAGWAIRPGPTSTATTG